MITRSRESDRLVPPVPEDSRNGAATPRPRRRRAAAIAALAAAAVAAAAAAVAGGPAGGPDGPETPVATGRTATVSREDLVDRDDVDGTLTYADERPVLNRREQGTDEGGGGSGGGGEGAGGSRGGGEGAGESGDDGAGSGGDAAGGSATITRLAREGSVVRRGDMLFEVDGEPVVLLYGRRPAYRELRAGVSDGADVLQLERNLAALGMGAGMTVDDHWSAQTTAAVKRWQRSLGVSQTGAVELGSVVFLPGARRIGAHTLDVGAVAGAGTEVLETTSTRRVVSIELDVAKQSLVRRGDTVTVTLPDGSTLRGRIASVGRVARQKDDGGGQGGGDQGDDAELVIDVSVILRGRRGVSRLDEAPVSVGIAQEVKRDVLAVPVTALLAQPGGGYAVRVVERGTSRLVAVDTGLFAGGLVEISGRGIREGVRVAVAE